MNFFIWSGFYSLIANGAIGIYVYSRRPKELSNRLFCIFSFLIAGWSVGSFFANIIADKVFALQVLRFNYLFGIWLPPTFLNFMNSVSQVEVKHHQKMIACGYLISAALSFFVFTPFFIKDLKNIADTGFLISSPGVAYYAFFIFFCVGMIEVLGITIANLRSKQSEDPEQFHFLALANLLAIFAGFEYFSRVFGFFKSPPFDDYILVVYTLIVGFAILRHKLFDAADILAIRKDKLALVGLITSSVSHELKNPLFLIQEYIRKTSKMPAVVNDSEARESMSKLGQQTERIDKLVKRLNDFSKPYNNGSEVDEVDLAEAIENALFFASQELKYLNISTVINIDPSLPKVRGDRGDFEEIFLNLIVNAFHAMPDGGKLTIDAHTTDGGKGIEIAIQDTGSGIPPGQLGNIFKPFYTTKSKFGSGTGLGLYIVKNLVEKNGGKISAVSKIGTGAFFQLKFDPSFFNI